MADNFGLLLSDDLMFTSRITGVGRDLGLSIKAARSADALLALARQQPSRCVIVDLSNPGLVLADLLAGLRECGSPRVVAYGSHVDTESLRSARAAGCDPVLPRSKFVEELPAALPDWFGVVVRDRNKAVSAAIDRPAPRNNVTGSGDKETGAG